MQKSLYQPMWQSEKGVVTSSVRHNDGTCVVRVFTLSYGMVPFIFYLSKKGKKASRNTLIQPMTQIEFETDYIPSATLMKMRDIKNAKPYKEIPFNPKKSAISLFMSEYLTHALSREQSNPGLFDYIVKSIGWLDNANEGKFANFHLLFALGVSSYTGICPNTDEYRPGYLLNLREGNFIPSPPGHNDYADANLSYKIALLAGADFDTMSDIPLTGAERVEILNILNHYFRLHIPSFPILKSIEVLQAVFG